MERTQPVEGRIEKEGWEGEHGTMEGRGNKKRGKKSGAKEGRREGGGSKEDGGRLKARKNVGWREEQGRMNGRRWEGRGNNKEKLLNHCNIRRMYL